MVLRVSPKLLVILAACPNVGFSLSASAYDFSMDGIRNLSRPMDLLVAARAHQE